MYKWLVLFRGINVGGNNIVPMKQLVEVLNAAGCLHVSSYIQSGNVLLSHQESDKQTLSIQIANLVEKNFGFTPKVMLLDIKEFNAAVSNNPFNDAEKEPKTLHFYFLGAAPENADIRGLEAVKKDNEAFKLIDKVFYLHAPDGIGRSKLAEKAEKLLAVPATARNWNTVTKLLALSSG
ncbi:MAG: hypothetical protein ACI808_001942 [Paraglaciecola sp.]|jgi:uncharacterized protein (DUF1697 family)